jgi:hypothetical protein
LKNAIIICGANTAAAQSMAANLAASGYENCDILSPDRDAIVLENAPHIGRIYALGRDKLKESALAGGPEAAGAALELELQPVLSKKYDASFNAGTGRTGAALQYFINADFKAGLSLKDESMSYNGPWYFLEMLNRGEIYSSGFYNDVSFYNSLLIGAAGSITDFSPALTRTGTTAESAVFAPVNSCFTASMAAECSMLFEKTGFSSRVLKPSREEALKAAVCGARCFITDYPAAAAIAAAAGSKTLYLCRGQRDAAKGPFCANAATMSGKINARLIMETCASSNGGKTCAALKSWECGGPNPFYVMENEINGFFGKYKGVDADIYSDALKGKDAASGAFVMYKNLFSIRVSRDEQAGGKNP